MFATHALLELAKISGFRFGLSQSLQRLPLKDRELWFEIVQPSQITSKLDMKTGAITDGYLAAIFAANLKPN